MLVVELNLWGELRLFVADQSVGKLQASYSLPQIQHW